MAHRILYDHIPSPEDPFQTFRLLWEPYTNQVALRFRNVEEAANGIVGSAEEMIEYLDKRARGGPPWDRGAPREARRELARISGRVEETDDQPAVT